MKVGVIDYGMGNLHSVSKALEHAGAAHVELIEQPERLKEFDRVVLPGVGAMGACVDAIRQAGFDQALAEYVQHRPMLGVCVGMQALFENGDENGGVDGLGWFHGHVNHFHPDIRAQGLKIPHMGWNQVQHNQHPLFDGIAQDERFYFVHSFRVSDSAEAIARADHGGEFVAAVGRDNVVATQFHPEKSQHAGLQLYANFLKWMP
ncbi:MAG: imidazole glycerol phosphate synthase subunit HisH [Litorivicinus sp.]